MFGRLILTLRHAGDLLHETIWFTVSDLPAVQASFTSERHRISELHSTTQLRRVKAFQHPVQFTDGKKNQIKMNHSLFIFFLYIEH